MSQIEQMLGAGRTNTGYVFQAAPEGLPEALKAIGWNASKPVDGCEQYVITKDDQWAEQFRGTHDECFTKLLRLQSQSVDWALENGGWYIISSRWFVVLANLQTRVKASFGLSRMKLRNLPRRNGHLHNQFPAQRFIF